jgi:hypothetical protein
MYIERKDDGIVGPARIGSSSRRDNEQHANNNTTTSRRRLVSTIRPPRARRVGGAMREAR